MCIGPAILHKPFLLSSAYARLPAICIALLLSSRPHPVNEGREGSILSKDICEVRGRRLRPIRHVTTLEGTETGASHVSAPVSAFHLVQHWQSCWQPIGSRRDIKGESCQ